MHNGKTISLGQILWKVMNNKLITDLSYDDAATYAIEALRLIGAPLVYENKVTRPPIKIIQHKAALPQGIINIRGIKLLHDDYVNNNEILNQDLALIYATDIYHQDTDCNDGNCDDETEFTYEIQHGIITTSFKEGYILVSYKGISLDNDGYPAIPDDQDVMLCLEYYILFRYLENLWALSKIPDKVFNYYDQKKCWYMGAANSSMQMPSIDQLETVMNSVTRILHNNQRHEQFFEKMGKKERIRKHH
jgi:hypothetical protein